MLVKKREICYCLCMDNAVLISDLVAENAALKAELSEVKQQLSWLMEQVSSNRRRLYGSSSEKSAYDGVGVQMGLFHEAPGKAFAHTLSERAETKPAKATPRKRGEMSSRLPDNMKHSSLVSLKQERQLCPFYRENTIE